MKRWISLTLIALGLIGWIVTVTPTGQAQTEQKAKPATTTEGKDKYSSAIISLYKRMQELDGKNKALQSKVAQQDATIASMRQEINRLQTETAFNRSAIEKLHQRLTALDAKSKSIVFPQE